VQAESLAPARMAEFMEKHLADCQICLRDPDVRLEVDRIIEIVVPPSKLVKTVKKGEEPSPEEKEDEEVVLAGEEGDEEDEEQSEEMDDLDIDDEEEEL